VFVTYEKEKPINILYFTSEVSGPKITFNKNLLIKELADEIILDKTNIEKAFDILGAPEYEGKRINTQTGVINHIAFYDASKLQNDGAINTGNKIDQCQVDALLRKAPNNIDEIKKVFGDPSALGIKSLKGEEPMVLSNWSYSNTEMKGKEHNFIPPGASDEEREKLANGKTYMVMEISQSRLMVGHDKEGRIIEIIWFKPI